MTETTLATPWKQFIKANQGWQTIYIVTLSLLNEALLNRTISFRYDALGEKQSKNTTKWNMSDPVHTPMASNIVANDILKTA